MEFIKHWAMLLCAMCVLYSVSEGILPKKAPFSVIKLACTLYILIVLLSPPKQNIFKDLKFSGIQQTEYENMGYEIFETNTVEYTQKLLCEELERHLAGSGCGECTSDILLNKDDSGNLSVLCVYIYMPQDADEYKIRSETESFFGCNVNCVTEVYENAG